MLNPSGGTVRSFGGVGLSVKRIGFELEAERSKNLEIVGSKGQRDRVREIVEKFSQIYNIPSEVKIKILESIPSHVGLGSTTQLTLAICKALVTLFEKEISVIEIARDMGRGKRSGIGTYAFDNGGFIVEGGIGEDKFPPLILRHEFPENWRFVIAIPKTERGPIEEREAKYFEDLGNRENISKEICYILMLKLIPALKKGNISEFGEALLKIDENVGRAFSSEQEGLFKDRAVFKTRNFMHESGAYGVGQSSWGPTVYGLTENRNQAVKLKNTVKNYLENVNLLGNVKIVEPDNRGAEIEKTC